MDITAWLTSLGLGRYAAAFRANDIDVDVLPELTAEDLKDLGVTSIGHRRKLLASIARSSASSASRHPTRRPDERDLADPAGRR